MRRVRDRQHRGPGQSGPGSQSTVPVLRAAAVHPQRHWLTHPRHRRLPRLTHHRKSEEHTHMTELDEAAEPLTRQRLMPPGSWDWHIPTPFSQGWKVGNLVFVGGQLSADEHGNVIGRGDIEVQTRNVFEAITRVLEQGGATWRDVVKLNTYYCCDE